MPTIFDDWNTFVREYCLSVEPGFTREEAIRAFVTLGELWPDCLTARLWGAGRGIMNIVFLVRLGNTLADTRNAPGFENVLRRARNDERSALSELYFAARLSRLGYAPRFEQEFDGKRPDLAIETDGVDVCFEIIAPEQSDLDKSAAKVMDKATALLKAPPGQRLNVKMLAFPTDDAIEQLRGAIQSAPAEQWNEIPGIARWEIEAMPPNGPGSHFSWPGNDTRAVRLVRDEYHHFTGDRPYVLVVDANAPLLTMPGWIVAFERTFQPERYRKLSAGLVFDNYAIPPHFSLQWRVQIAENRFATNPVPRELVARLASLDEPMITAAT
jgi:hypothetical protein